MTDTVGDLAQSPIRGIRLTSTLRQAAIELSEEQVGALIVRDRRGVLGVVTEFDIARVLAEGADPDEARVQEFMTDDVVTIPSTATLPEAADSMARHEIRHLLVVGDDEDTPLGVISARDLLPVVGDADA